MVCRFPWSCLGLRSRTTVSHEDRFHSQKTYLIRHPFTQALLLRFAGCKVMTSWMLYNIHAGGEVGKVFAYLYIKATYPTLPI